MEKKIINEKQIGLSFKNGKLEKVLRAGKYLVFKSTTIELVDLEEKLTSNFASLDTLMENKEIKELYELYEVKPNQVLVRFLNGKVQNLYGTGIYAFYKFFKSQKFEYLDITSPLIYSEEISEEIVEQFPYNWVKRDCVSSYEKGILTVNGKFERVLEPGKYYFWYGKNAVVNHVDTRIQLLNINGQEILTQDKVNIRINLIVNYRVTDWVRAVMELSDYEEHIRIKAQLALREYASKHKLDEILEAKEEISSYVYEKLKEKEVELFVEIKEAGIKDIILPGEIRNIMNTILLAEKKAQANVITRREEVASTRSLLNTAKLMDENKTLYKLKELEYLEKICENIDSINLNGGTGILSALTSLLGKQEQGD